MSGRTALLMIAALLASSCSFMDVKTEVAKSDPSFKGKRTDEASIEVFEEGAPTPPYREIATIRAEGRRDVDQGELVKACRIRAARLGADAVVNIRFGEDLKRGGAGGEMVCPFEGACYYQETGSTIVGMPTAECTAVVFSDRKTEIGE
jgi:hypothetical protein